MLAQNEEEVAAPREEEEDVPGSAEGGIRDRLGRSPGYLIRLGCGCTGGDPQPDRASFVNRVG